VAQAGARGEPYVLLYVPGGGDPPRQTPARGFAVATGMTYRATLTRMRRDGLAGLAKIPPPPGVVLRPLGPDVDLDTYVSLINASFASHPTWFHVDTAAVARAHAAPDFDTDGIALVAPEDRPDAPVGFVRTYAEADDAGVVAGVVGHVGVLPAWRGRGLGRVLVRWALRRFAAQGLDRAELSVVAANADALHLYESEGFVTVVAWPQWSKDVPSAG
jgi:mycothiol synthase